MKRKPIKVQLSERQQLILGLALVILVAVSMLYCLGFASVTLLQTLENVPFLWNDQDSLEETVELTPAPLLEPTDSSLSPL